MLSSGNSPSPPAGACPGWLMTAVAPWGENAEDAYDQGLVEMGLGDSRLIEVQGAFLPMGFEATPNRSRSVGPTQPKLSSVPSVTSIFRSFNGRNLLVVSLALSAIHSSSRRTISPRSTGFLE